VLVENRHGLIAAAMATQADGTAERDAALLMLNDLQEGRGGRITLGADKAYDTQDFVSTVRHMRVTPHVTQNTTNRRSAIDARTTRHPGYEISLSKRWLVEKPFGWLKQTEPLKKVKLRGLAKVDWLFVFSCQRSPSSGFPNCGSSAYEPRSGARSRRDGGSRGLCALTPAQFLG
jgi:hypothetical protein